jgi:hypothetical protein
MHTSFETNLPRAIHYLTFPLMEENTPPTLILSRNVYAQLYPAAW